MAGRDLAGINAVAGSDQAAAPNAGAKRLIPQAWRTHPEFDNIHKLVGVAVITVQLRYNGWVTELADQEKMMQLNQASTWGLHRCLPISRQFANCWQSWDGWVQCAGRIQAAVVAPSVFGLCCAALQQALHFGLFARQALLPAHLQQGLHLRLCLTFTLQLHCQPSARTECW